MVVAGDRQHPAKGAAAGRIAVLQRIAAAVDPGPLPYQMAKTPSLLAPGNNPICWLPHTAQWRPSSSLIAGWNVMWAALEKSPRAPQRLIEAAERRAAIIRR